MQKISIANKEYNYKIRYSKRAKYLKLQVNEHGLELILPYGISVAEGEKFLIKNRGWIDKHLERYNGSSCDYFYLGRQLRIDLKTDTSAKFIRIEMISSEHIIITGVGPPLSINRIYDHWMRNQAKLIIPERVKHLAEKYGFVTGKISIRTQKTRWGSCARNGNLSFNSKLMMFDPSIIDYVIIHELCHLREMNHSQKFWDEVAAIIPEYKKIKSKLKKNFIK